MGEGGTSGWASDRRLKRLSSMPISCAWASTTQVREQKWEERKGGEEERRGWEEKKTRPSNTSRTSRRPLRLFGWAVGRRVRWGECLRVYDEGRELVVVAHKHEDRRATQGVEAHRLHHLFVGVTKRARGQKGEEEGGGWGGGGEEEEEETKNSKKRRNEKKRRKRTGQS